MPTRFLLACTLALAACASPALPPSGGPEVLLGLTNRTSDTVCFLFLARPNSDRWSADVLGTQDIPSGATRQVRIPSGFWDLRTENCAHELLGVLRAARITRATTLVLQ